METVTADSHVRRACTICLRPLSHSQRFGELSTRSLHRIELLVNRYGASKDQGSSTLNAISGASMTSILAQF